jgi:hypothetical protein
MKLPKLKLQISSTLLILLILAFSILTFSYIDSVSRKVLEMEESVERALQSNENIKNSINISLYEDHLKLSSQVSLESETESLKLKIEELSNIKENQNYLAISEIYKLYGDFQSKLKRNVDENLDTGSFKGKAEVWGSKLIANDLDSLKSEIIEANKVLDDSYEKYLDSLPKPAPTVVAPPSAGGGNYTTVETDRGKFSVYLIKVSLSGVKVVTSSANNDDCKNNCPTKSLADHVKDNNGFAGINGTYFCPPDYSSCSGKVNSSDYAFYKSSSGKWLNKGALSWGDTGLATFNGRSAKFYKRSTDYGGGSVTAGISNYPTLLYDGNIVVDAGKLTSYQKDVKGARGVIGVDGSDLYLAIVSNATVVDAAYVMKSLGVKYALNLDGGGSSALYLDGSYIVGPGRSLPNAVVLVK